MTRSLYAIDTHTLYWYETADPQLSPKAQAIFAEAEQGRAELILNPIVLAEFYYVLRKVGLDSDFSVYLAFIEANSIYHLEPIVWDDIRQLPRYTDIPEMHDRLIAIQAVRLGATLVTRDRTLQSCARVRWIW
jgi:predicted nucleic acid-binding protein